ncbi:hypothetical protein E2C01_067118 [Portunus trituberculatus]|uniref:Uncharacterized protein n=1 Tax=Portunus trituberculatus TaxID=210409 RepID=A0A5B7HWM0_PORTR|nr:hypothetical protein [Portunus trituberculatus]
MRLLADFTLLTQIKLPRKAQQYSNTASPTPHTETYAFHTLPRIFTITACVFFSASVTLGVLGSWNTTLALRTYAMVVVVVVMGVHLTSTTSISRPPPTSRAFELKLNTPHQRLQVNGEEPYSPLAPPREGLPVKPRGETPDGDGWVGGQLIAGLHHIAASASQSILASSGFHFLPNLRNILALAKILAPSGRG